MHAPIAVQPERRARPRKDQRTGSFLVRTWREGVAEGGTRYFIRNLRTGEETYLSEPHALIDCLELQAEAGPES